MAKSTRPRQQHAKRCRVVADILGLPDCRVGAWWLYVWVRCALVTAWVSKRRTNNAREQISYDTGVVSGAMLLVKDDLGLSVFQQEMIVSSTVAGAAVGAMAGAWDAGADAGGVCVSERARDSGDGSCAGAALADAYGRRRAVMVSGVSPGEHSSGAATAAPCDGWRLAAATAQRRCLCWVPGRWARWGRRSPRSSRGARSSVWQWACHRWRCRCACARARWRMPHPHALSRSYLAETAPASHRGLLVTAYVLFVTGGQVRRRR